MNAKRGLTKPSKRTELSRIQPLELSLECFGFLAVTGHRQCHRSSVGMEAGDGVQQKVGTLDPPKLSDVKQVGGVLIQSDGIELGGRNAIENATDQPRRFADDPFIGFARELALKQEEIGAVHERAFEARVKCALERIRRIVKRAAVRRINADHSWRSGFQAKEDAGLCAMTMQDVRLEPIYQPQMLDCRRNIGEVGSRWIA